MKIFEKAKKNSNKQNSNKQIKKRLKKSIFQIEFNSVLIVPLKVLVCINIGFFYYF